MHLECVMGLGSFITRFVKDWLFKGPCFNQKEIHPYLLVECAEGGSIDEQRCALQLVP